MVVLAVKSLTGFPANVITASLIIRGSNFRIPVLVSEMSSSGPADNRCRTMRVKYFYSIIRFGLRSPHTCAPQTYFYGEKDIAAHMRVLFRERPVVPSGEC